MEKLKTFLIWFGVGLFLGFVLLNFYFSQKAFPKLYNKFIWGDKRAVNTYLEVIKTDPNFFPKLLRVREVFGEAKISEFVKSQKRTDNEVKKIKKALLINPESPELLYTLYTLYQQKGEKKSANFYLKKTCNLNPLYSEKCM